MSTNSLTWYIIKEYLAVYDIKDFPERLKFLKAGANVYFNSGYSFYQFHRFHRNKQKIYSWCSYLIVISFLFFSILVYLSSEAPYLSIPILLSGILVRRVFISPAISANILHVNKMLEGPNGMENLRQLLDLPIDDDEKLKKFVSNVCLGHPFSALLKIQKEPAIIDEKNHDGEIESAAFVKQLVSISNLPNKFNSMPMVEVIDFFSVMCCKSCSKEIPQMSEKDFIRFLENGFVNPTKKEKIRLSTKKLMVTYQIFHQFYIISYNKMYTRKDDLADRYISLLTDFMDGFENDKVKNNFRTNDDNFLLKIREKYKMGLQEVQRLQTMYKA